LVLSEAHHALRWFMVYLALVIISGFLQDYVRVVNKLPPLLTLVFFVMNIGAVSVTAFVMLSYFVTQKDIAFRLLSIEQGKSEDLLLNVLPKEIAEVLKVESRTIARHHDEASILFADLVGFTPLSAHMAPAEMVELLNEIFSHFDSLVDQYGVEKIRTIGDNYMAASGVPSFRPDHAQVLADMALDMMAYTRQLPPQNGNTIGFRIGLSSGALVAGVIGHKKFHYDVWGDTVNIASRMESQGVRGKIQITDAMRDVLGEEYVFQSRGVVEIKGKGAMQTWFLIGKAGDE
jgi:guanylate cyclase